MRGKPGAGRPTFFDTAAGLRAWFERHHATATELLAGFRTRGRIHPAELTAFERRTEEKSRICSCEQRYEATLDAHHHETLRSNWKAWAFFESQPPSHRPAAYWVVARSERRPDSSAWRP